MKCYKGYKGKVLGSYCFAERTKEFCDLFLGAIMAPYLTRKDAESYG